MLIKRNLDHMVALFRILEVTTLSRICGQAYKCWKHQGYRNMSMQKVNVHPLVAVCQLTSTPQKEDNFAVCKQLIEKAKSLGAAMVFLPECFDYVSESTDQATAMAETMDGSTISRYKQIARQLQIWISLGGFHEKGPDNDPHRIYNSHIILDTHGKVVSKYCKAHLFDVDIKGKVKLQETSFTIPGPYIVPPITTPAGKLGLSVCYDLRFPQLSTALVQMGAEMLTFPSAFTVPTGLAHWEVLLRSRAIENQCYVIAAAQTGKHHEKRTSYGHAMVVDPWGSVIAQCHEGTGICLAEIDLDYLKKVRSEMPVWSHQRHDLYGSITPKVKDINIDEQKIYQFGQYTIPSEVVFYKSSLCIAFVNRKPVVPGHVLVSPLRVVKQFEDLLPHEISDIFLVTQTVSKVIQKQYGANALTMAIQDGADAGQTVEHVHVHILPRKPGDFPENDTIYTELEKHDKDECGKMLEPTSLKWRPEAEMIEEARVLRTLFS